MTIILLNLLIAYLSNVFSRLEEQNFLIGLQDKAKMILDFELIVNLFQSVFRKKNKVSILYPSNLLGQRKSKDFVYHQKVGFEENE